MENNLTSCHFAKIPRASVLRRSFKSMSHTRQAKRLNKNWWLKTTQEDTPRSKLGQGLPTETWHKLLEIFLIIILHILWNKCTRNYRKTNNRVKDLNRKANTYGASRVSQSKTTSANMRQDYDQRVLKINTTKDWKREEESSDNMRLTEIIAKILFIALLVMIFPGSGSNSWNR